MPRALKPRIVATVATLALSYALTGQPPAAFAAAHDGNWTVLVITEKGTCDR